MKRMKRATIYLSFLIGLSAAACAESTASYRVLFDYGDRTEEATVEQGSAASEPKPPEREGYVFVGWYADGAKYDFSRPVVGDVTLTAVWEKIESDPPTTDPEKPSDPEEPKKPDEPNTPETPEDPEPPDLGDGSREKPYLVADAKRFEEVIGLVEGGKAQAHIKLTADLTLENEQIENFGGVFDGDGHTVTVKMPLFRELDGATVKRLKLKGEISYRETEIGDRNFGALACLAKNSTIEGCSWGGKISLSALDERIALGAGGLIGRMVGGKMSSCMVSGEMSSAGENLTTGGLVGVAESGAAIENSCFDGSLSEAIVSGGIVGYLGEGSRVSKCRTSGAFAVTASDRMTAVGAIAGIAEVETKVENSYSTAELEEYGKGLPVLMIKGDLIGKSYPARDGKEASKIENSYFKAEKIEAAGASLSDKNSLFGLLHWSETEWDFHGGTPIPKN